MADGLLGRLREGINSTIWEDEHKAGSSPAATPQPVQPAVSAVQNSGVVSFPTGDQFQRVDPQIKAQLDQAVTEANQMSYTEFLNYLEAMSSALAGSDEGTRYRAALAAAAKKGFTPQEIVKGIDAVLQVLQTEDHNFNESASQRIADRVGTREKDLTDMERQMNENNSKISQLQAQNSQLTARRRALTDEIRDEKQKVEERKRVFSATVAAETSRYETEKQKVLAYSGRGA